MYELVTKWREEAKAHRATASQREQDRIYFAALGEAAALDRTASELEQAWHDEKHEPRCGVFSEHCVICRDEMEAK